MNVALEDLGCRTRYSTNVTNVYVGVAGYCSDMLHRCGSERRAGCLGF